MGIVLSLIRLTAPVLVGILMAPALASIEAQTCTIDSPTATLSAEFSRINSMRELSNGHVLLTDFDENRIVLADFTHNLATSFGRLGDGPGEFRHVYPLEAVGRDSTLMGNAIARRWLLITDDTVMVTLSPNSPLARLSQGVAERLGFDRTGRMLAIRSPGRRSRGATVVPYDMVLIRLAGLVEDTIEHGGKSFPALVPASNDRPSFPAYTSEEQRVIAVDGWVAILRPNPYRVDWYSPAGQWMRGAAIENSPLRFDRREKDAYMARLATRQSPVTSRISPNSARSKTPQPISRTWPDVIPAYTGSGAALPTTDGRLVVRRTPTADYPKPRYDVINHRGVRECQVTVAQNQRILGFGRGVVYLVTTDDATGFEQVSRHAWLP